MVLTLFQLHPSCQEKEENGQFSVNIILKRWVSLSGIDEAVIIVFILIDDKGRSALPRLPGFLLVLLLFLQKYSVSPNLPIMCPTSVLVGGPGLH